MAIPTIDDVIVATTADEIFQSVLDLCASADPPLPVTSWQSGDPIRTMIWNICQVVAAKLLVSIEIAKGGLGDLASGEWVKLWAWQIYNVLFVQAEAATGYVTITNTTDDPYIKPAGLVILAHDTTGKTYRTQVDVNVPPHSAIDSIAIMADEIGTGSNAAPNTIRRLVTSAVGISVTNPSAVLGADEETPAALVKRCRAKLGSFSPLGPKDVYDFVARTPLSSFDPVDDYRLTDTDTPITRSRTTADPVTGIVTTYIATAGGAPSSGDVDKVNLAFARWAEPHGVRSRAAAAAELAVDISYQVWVKTGLTQAQVQLQVQSAVIIYFAAIDVGGLVIPPDSGKVYAEGIENTIHKAVPGTQRVKVTAPAIDVDVLPNQVPVVGTITPAVTTL